jgi:hypothetical protein
MSVNPDSLAKKVSQRGRQLLTKTGWLVLLARFVAIAAGILLAGVGILLILGQLNFLGKSQPGLAIYI